MLSKKVVSAKKFSAKCMAELHHKYYAWTNKISEELNGDENEVLSLWIYLMAKNCAIVCLEINSILLHNFCHLLWTFDSESLFILFLLFNFSMFHYSPKIFTNQICGAQMSFVQTFFCIFLLHTLCMKRKSTSACKSLHPSPLH